MELRQWEEEYKALRLQYKHCAVDLFKLSKLLRFTAASTRKAELAQLQSKEDVRDFERHREQQSITQRIKELRCTTEARELLAFKQQMEKVYSQIQKKSAVLGTDLYELSSSLDELSSQTQLCDNRITEREEQLVEEDEEEDQEQAAQPRRTVQGKVMAAQPTEQETIEKVNAKLHKLGPYLGWRAGDHLQFMQIFTRHKQQCSQKFIAEASSTLAVPPGKVVEHVERLEEKLRLQGVKKDLIQEHKQRKSLERRAEQQLRRSRQQQEKERERERRERSSRASVQKKRMIEEYKQSKQAKPKPTRKIPLPRR